jgi:putative transposase
MMCRAFNVSKSGYYAFLKRPQSRRSAENEQLTAQIREVHEKSRSTYGSPRITAVLWALGMLVSRSRVARLMQRAQIRSKLKRRFVATTDSAHGHRIAPNILDRQFEPGRLRRAWVSDITYIHTLQGWLYLTVIIDLGDRRVIGWALSSTLHASVTVVAAWRMALANRGLAQGLVFHSDRGTQYACKEFRELLERGGMVTQSMSRKGDCWDNAVAESFFKSLKEEWLKGQVFKTRQQAESEIFKYIEVWYNRQRLHSSLGYKSPEQYARANTKATNAA